MTEESLAPLSEEEMRQSFAEKEVIREAERKRLSRKTTKIVGGTLLVVVVAILCTPLGWESRDPTDGPSSDLAAKAARIQAQLAGGQGGEALVPSDGTPEGDARRSDAHFALDLLRYVQPEKQGTAPPVQQPKAK